MDHPDWHRAGRAPKAAVRTVAQMAVDHDADGLARRAHVAHRQVWVIGARRAGTNHDRVMPHPHGVHRAARLRPGDPAAFAACCRDTPVDGGGKLQRDEGQALLHAFQKACVHGPCLGAADALDDLDPRRAQHLVATPGNPRVRVCQRSDNARDPRLDQPLGTRGGVAMMGAGLQRDIGCGTTGERARLIQRPTFGVGAATRLGPAAPHYAVSKGAACHDDTTHRRVGPCIPKPPRRQRKGRSHVVVIAHSSVVPGAGRSSETNLSKSSAAWKFLYTLAKRT